MEVEWDSETVTKFYNYLCGTISYQNCVELEKDLRIETGTEEKLNKHSCSSCSDHHGDVNISCFKFKKDDDDVLGEILDSEKDQENVKASLAEITQKAFTIYSNVIAKAASKGDNKVTLETDHFLRSDILRLVFSKYITTKAKERITEISSKSTKNIVTLANPLNMNEHDLNKIETDTIANLMHDYVGLQKNFLGRDYTKLIFDELVFIEYNNQFNSFGREYKNVRTDFYCWTYITSLDRQKQRGLYKLLKELSLLPYELNKKANLSLQIGTLFQFLYFSPNKSYLKKHCQGGYGKMDNGKKVTCIYVPFVHSNDDVEIKLYRSEYNGVNEESEESEGRGKTEPNVRDATTVPSNQTDDGAPFRVIKPESDSLIFLQTRNVSYEISKTKNKFFTVNFSISGPVSTERRL
ncbi:conserved Plasmodium protein, unknown function [Plasmodium vivax]|uniref:Uncharacterized protein n=4 Tax=Plasmodium vivax TaxID=5855 RepID=A5K3W1_PLAVS|nr:hypothetical protein, conserved [Plasmodium vivax]KMZ91758.1 hypothetical protein PVMG_00631 [Plasmodium vivax Mauritania I]KMZ97782.1 hypothetical protein PVNG_03629 [Plasmodium vivax North Korean]EDL46215.1 hypothetical protein, conserved [Plasmodium vivax]CAG9473954.1 unnamed protein product [Plasmodium vivax]CAI7722436.1 prolyl hydroxylase-like protein, putative [Plasmodium vivax]|eukprot:XP_001615942.1 hypothetical protein [Plasmodium vivax Sal-1]